PARQRVLFVDEADAPAVLRREPLRIAAEDARTARRGWQEAEQDAEQRRLARTVRTHDGVDAPARNAQCEMVECELAAVALGERVGFDDVIVGHGVSVASASGAFAGREREELAVQAGLHFIR